MNVSSVVAIQTLGRADKRAPLWLYRLEYSEDCIHFKSLLVFGSTKNVV